MLSAIRARICLPARFPDAKRGILRAGTCRGRVNDIREAGRARLMAGCGQTHSASKCNREIHAIPRPIARDGDQRTRLMKRFFPPPRRMIAISSRFHREAASQGGWGEKRITRVLSAAEGGQNGISFQNSAFRGNILMRAFAFISTQRGVPRRFSNVEHILLRFTSHAAAARNNKSLVLFPISVLFLSLAPIGGRR